MISKNLSRKSIAACISVAVFSVYSMIALASPATKAAGELSISGHVTVNGQKVISGGTLFSDSVIVTADKSSATVNISKLGRLELSPNTSLKLTFNEKSISGWLDSGTARVSTLTGVSVNFTTKNGAVVVDGSESTTFVVTAKDGNTVLSTEAGLAELRAGDSVKRVAAGENATAGTPTPQGSSDDGIGGGALAVLLIAVGLAVAAAIIAATSDNDINVGGSPIVISPAK